MTIALNIIALLCTFDGALNLTGATAGVGVHLCRLPVRHPRPDRTGPEAARRGRETAEAGLIRVYAFPILGKVPNKEGRWTSSTTSPRRRFAAG